MDDQDKIAVINLLLGKLPEKDKDLLKRRFNNEPELSALYDNYRKAIQKIDLFYAYKSIKSDVNSEAFESDFKQYESMANQENINSIMGTTGKTVLWIILMVFIAFFASWSLTFVRDWRQNKADLKFQQEQQKILVAKKDSISKAAKIEAEQKRITGVNFSGIALTRTGLYLAPYAWAHEGTILANLESNINKVPATVLWDDKDAGLAVLQFALEDQVLTNSLPYSFSNEKYFLGEEVVAISKIKGKIIFNYGRVIDDDENSDTLMINLQLDNEILGAPVFDNSGKIIGIIKNVESNGKAVVQKSISVFSMISEMNLDKGIGHIIVPSKNSLSKLSNSDRIKAISPFLVHFNVRRN